MLTHTEIVQKAADIIETRGLANGVFEDLRTGAVCALGAIDVALGNNPGNGTAGYHPATFALERALCLGKYDLPSWSNALAHQSKQEFLISELRRVAPLLASVP